MYLAVAIVAEVIATSALKASEGFSRLVPSLVVVAGYGIAFFCLSLTLRTIPVGIVYAIWSGVGIVLIALTGYFVFGQVLDAPADYPKYGPGYYAVFFADPDGLKLEYVFKPL